ncbi:MAG: glycosyltransferase family 39 protein, partial [Chloroflexota bacterium]
MRWLLLADLVVTALSGALLITSPITFSYYEYGWIAHVLVTLIVVLMARRRATRLLIGLSALTLPIALLVLPAHFGALDLMLILWTLGALPLISAGLIKQGTQPYAPTKTRFAPEQIIRLLLIGVIATGCIVSLRSIRDFPNFSATDEAMIFNYIDTFERTGKIEASLIPYPAPVVTGNLYTVAAALWINVFRDDPFALRNFSTVGGLLLIAVVFATGRALRDGLTGGIAAALLATNLLWMAVSHVGRQEVWLAVFVWTAYWLSLEARKRESRWIAALAGVMVALSADVHPLGALACVALGGWWISQCGWRIGSVGRVIPLTPADQERVSFPSPTQAERGEKNAKPELSPINSRLLMMFILGGLIGTAYYVSVHVLPDPGYFLAGVRDELVSYGAEGS